MLSYLSDVFATASSDLRFLTVKGEKKYQQIETVRKLCAKVSNSYVIVRERNKMSEGYHFHALLKVITPPTKSWFKKGVHMNLKKVGRPDTNIGLVLPVQGYTKREIKDALDDGGMTTEQVEDIMLAKLHKSCRKKNRKMRQCENVLTYMSKELEMPIQYTDYILVIDKKNYKIRDG